MAIPNYSTSPRLTRWLEDRSGGKIISFVVIPLLLIAALVLPPISLPQRVLGSGMTEITGNGGTITDPDGTQVTFLPGTIERPFRARLSSIPRVAFLEGSAGSELLAAAKAIPSHIIAKSPYYGLDVSGPASAQTVIVLPIPNDSEPYETLDLYSWDKATQSWQWLPHTVIYEDDQIETRLNFVPESIMVMQTNPMPQVIGADLTQASALPAEGQGAFAQINPAGLYLGGEGGLDGELDASFDQLVSSYQVVPVIRNYDGPVVRSDLLANMLIDPAQSDAHIDALVNLAVGNLYAGIDIDYHGLEPDLSREFNDFIARLASKLHAQGKSLSVRVEAPSQISEESWDTGAYDWKALGVAADTVKVPAPLDPRAYVPGGQAEALLRFAVGQVNRYKLTMVLNGQSIEQAGSYLLTKTYADALQPLIGRIQADQTVVEPGESLNLALVSSRPNSGLVYDPNIGAYVYRYQDDQGGARTVWLENAASLSHKLEILSHFGIQGFMVEHLPGDGQDADLWTLMRDYQQGSAKPIDSNFLVEWTIKGSNGELISQVRPLGDAGLLVSAPEQPGVLEVKAALVDRGQVLHEETSSDIAVATHTPAPSPTPEFTPTPEATATPSVAELTVTSATLNVRSGPGTAYARIGAVSQGEHFPITGKSEDGQWFQITLSDSQQGWVSAELVRASGPLESVAMVAVEPPPTPEPQAAAPVVADAAPAAPAPPPSGGGSFGYGMQIDPYGNRAATTAALKNAGFSWVKVQVPWKDFEGSPGVRNWPDDVVGDLSGAGLNVLASIVKSPQWARPGNTDLSVEGPPANPQDYANFVGAFAQHYCGKVQAIEVWNEQNLHYEWGNEPIDAGRYVQLLAAAYRSIKAACPSIIVVSGAPTPTGAQPPAAVPDFTYLEQMYQAGLKNYCDAVGVHPSGYGNPPDVRVQDFQAGAYNKPSHVNHASFYFRNIMEQYRNIMVKYGDSNKRLWPTEFGWASTSSPHPGYEYATYNSEQQQGEYIVRAYQMMKSWGFVGVAFLWNLDYNLTQPGLELAAFGIMGRPAYNMLAAMPK